MSPSLILLILELTNAVQFRPINQASTNAFLNQIKLLPRT